MEKVSKILQFIDENIAFGPHLIISLLALSVYLSFKTGFIQIKGLKKGFKLLLKNDETLENYNTRYNEYKEAYIMRKGMIDKLYDEIKIIKRLHV